MADDVVNVVPKNPVNPDETLDEVLNDIAKRTKFGLKFTSYEIRAADVKLVYQA